jgi:hypothetical protein
MQQTQTKAAPSPAENNAHKNPPVESQRQKHAALGHWKSPVSLEQASAQEMNRETNDLIRAKLPQA